MALLWSVHTRYFKRRTKGALDGCISSIRSRYRDLTRDVVCTLRTFVPSGGTLKIANSAVHAVISICAVQLNCKSLVISRSGSSHVKARTLLKCPLLRSVNRPSVCGTSHSTSGGFE
jgi:hypothetical protein